MTTSSIPRAVYRLQFNKDFTFRDATKIVPYLAAFGISHCYASPYLRARPGSTHGYDIIDHNALNPEIGTPEDFEEFVNTLHEHGMGQILDIVPNHMGVMGSDNAWWLEVLENGEASSYADFFDIDWEPLKKELRGKILVPILGDQYGTVLERGELQIRFDVERGEFSLYYFEHRFPLNPREYPRILDFDIGRLESKLGADNFELLELQNISASFRHLPRRHELTPEERAERLRDKEINKRRLAALCARSPEVTEFLQENVKEINGVPGEPASFQHLHELIKVQSFRLAYWRVAADDINYRRFFDVNDLAGLRQENEAVFDATHRYVLELINQGKLNGLRIDHPDGLYDPLQYLQRLQANDPNGQDANGVRKRLFLVVEKILTGDERLRPEWPVEGTTGYDFANLVNGLFVDGSAKSRMDRIYRGFIGDNLTFDEVVYQSKKLVMDRALASELNVLANRLGAIALANRYTCDFTLNGLRDALIEVVACFPVYRTYVSSLALSERDREYIEEAVGCAKARSAFEDLSVYDFVGSVLLTGRAQGTRGAYARAVLQFAMKFQQFTSALMAKGVEDTSFYRYFRLVSLNEVGGDPRRFGTTVEEFHRGNLERASDWPNSFLATSTHDTKRSEDVRARIDVLSEMPEQWRRQVRRFRDLNRVRKTIVRGGGIPTLNDEYLLYQTLIGAWPSDRKESGSETFRDRIRQYMMKAVREAKEQTSWANQNQEYENALIQFIDASLQDEQFVSEFTAFQTKISRYGIFNSLSQELFKLTCPGIPDIYQGTELWDFSLVDPDNRRRVDYQLRERLLREVQQIPKNAAGDVRDWLVSDGRAKLIVISRTLITRKQYPELFASGSYIPLRVAGEKAEHVVAFARHTDEVSMIVAAPRLTAKLLKASDTLLPCGEEVWGDTYVEVPACVRSSCFRNIITGTCIRTEGNGNAAHVKVSHLLSDSPVAAFLAEHRDGG